MGKEKKKIISYTFFSRKEGIEGAKKNIPEKKNREQFSKMTPSLSLLSPPYNLFLKIIRETKLININMTPFARLKN